MDEIRHSCQWNKCWINIFLEHDYQCRAVLWPKYHEPETIDFYYIWSFYVQWDRLIVNGQRGKVNKVNICPEHHEAIIKYQSDELAAEIREEELMEQWQQSQQTR